MKIAQINATYGIGSTGYLVKDLHEAFKENNIDSFVFWGTKCKNDNNDSNIIQVGNILDHKVHALLRRIFFDQGWHSKLATLKTCRLIKKLGVDAVILHNIHGNYIHFPTLIKFLAKENITVFAFLHDCWLFTGSCFHFYSQNRCQQWKNGCVNCPLTRKRIYKKRISMLYLQKKQLLSNIKNLYILSGTDWIMNLGLESFLGNISEHKKVNFWTDLKIDQSCTKNQIRQKYNINNCHKIILGSAQCWDSNKGIETFLQMADKLHNKATIILVGEPNGYADKEGLKFIGYTSNRQEMIDLYINADIFVNASKMETVGLVTLEAMLCGLPVAAYDNTGTSELIPKDCGWLVDDGDIPQMIETVDYALDIDKTDMKANCKEWVNANYNKINTINMFIKSIKGICNKRRIK